MSFKLLRPILHFVMPYILITSLLINHTVEEIMWADPGGTAIPGQPVTEVEQAPTTPSFSKNQFNILVLQCRTYQILS